MRWICCLIGILFISVLLQAQSAKLHLSGEPQKVDGEIEGVRDYSGRYCAAIEIAVPPICRTPS